MTRFLYLTDNEHVLAPDDALLHLGAQSFTDIGLIAVAVGGVNVAVASCDGGLYRTLDRGAGKMAGLQRAQHFLNLTLFISLHVLDEKTETHIKYLFQKQVVFLFQSFFLQHF